MANVRYRVWQLFAGWRARLTPCAITEIRALLTAAELRLFVGMLGRDQAHALRVLRAIQHESAVAGRTPSRPLLVAALLHDVGKGRVATWQRAATVVLAAVAPAFGARIASRSGAGWRQALWRLRHHAQIGAEQVAACGGDPRVVALIAAHSAPPPPDDRELAWLIAADRVS